MTNCNFCDQTGTTYNITRHMKTKHTMMSTAATHSGIDVNENVRLIKCGAVGNKYFIYCFKCHAMDCSDQFVIDPPMLDHYKAKANKHKCAVKIPRGVVTGPRGQRKEKSIIDEPKPVKVTAPVEPTISIRYLIEHLGEDLEYLVDIADPQWSADSIISTLREKDDSDLKALKQCEKLNRQASEMRQRISCLERELEAERVRFAVVTGKDPSIDESAEEIKGLKSVIDEMEFAISMHDSDIVSRDETIAALRAKLKQKDAKIDELDGEIMSLKMCIGPDETED
jgi:predicted RNase H-like nuclease (RuvC/YqgF family)